VARALPRARQRTKVRIPARHQGTRCATGLRNVEGLAFYPGTDELWITVNERDEFGARTPSNFLTRARDGDFFGSPYAYNGPNSDPIFGAKRPDLVAKTRVPDVLLGAHSAPLGLVFYTGAQFPPNIATTPLWRFTDRALTISRTATRWCVCDSRTGSRSAVMRISSPVSPALAMVKSMPGVSLPNLRSPVTGASFWSTTWMLVFGASA
jgi:hypothetical protein